MTASGHERPMVPEYFPMKTNQKSQAELLSRTIWLPASGRTLPHFRHRKVNFGNGQKRVDHRYMDKYISDRKSKISASKLVLAQIDPVILTSCQKCIFYHQTASASIPPSLYYLVGWRPTKTRIEALLTRAPNAVACNFQHFNSLKVDMDQSKPSLAPLISYYWTAKVHNRGTGFKTPQKICTSGVQWTKSWYPVQFARVNGGPLRVSFIVSTLAAAAVIAKAPTATEEISLSTRPFVSVSYSWYCRNSQIKFWTAHDKLSNDLKRLSRWSLQFIRYLAHRLRLNKTLAFQECLCGLQNINGHVSFESKLPQAHRFTELPQKTSLRLDCSQIGPCKCLVFSSI